MEAKTLASIALALASAGCAGTGDAPDAAHEAMAHGADSREAVRFPPELRMHTLAHMREHLAIVTRIQQALGRGDYDEAANLSEHELGLSSLEAHGAAQSAPYMPKGMQEAGLAMHRAASRFAIAASNSGATGDPKPAIAALGVLTAQCVGCHAAYRFD